METTTTHPECPGHPAGPHDPMGQTVYCDGTCQPPIETVSEAQLDAMVSNAITALEAPVNEELRKAITAQVGEGWTGDVDPPTAFAWDEALRRLVRCLMLNAFDYGDDGELVVRR
jgi:hypothetical protein